MWWVKINRASWKFSDMFHGRPFILGEKKEKSPQFFLELLCCCLRSQERQARQNIRLPGLSCPKICDKLGFGHGHISDQNKGHDYYFLGGVTGALNKSHRLPRTSTCSLHHLLWQNWFAYFWGGSQLEEASFITQIGEMKVIWAAWLQMQQKAANGRRGSKEKCQYTPWHHFVSTTADFLPCMPPLWHISGRARA